MHVLLVRQLPLQTDDQLHGFSHRLLRLAQLFLERGGGAVELAEFTIELNSLNACAAQCFSVFPENICSAPHRETLPA